MQCRRENRHSLNANCRVSSGPGLPRRAVVTDISTEGCAIVSPRLWLHKTDKVQVQIDARHTMIGEVRWSRLGEAVGLRFTRRLEPVEVDRIARVALRASINGAVPRRQVPLKTTLLRPVC